MKVVVNISNEQKDLFLSFMKENNFVFEIEEDLEIPQWQIDEVRNRRDQLVENPDMGIALDVLKERLEKRIR